MVWVQPQRVDYLMSNKLGSPEAIQKCEMITTTALVKKQNH